ncbi:MAG: hypothetical protein M3N23_10425, partial [Pseudomonadota bacterium]|nr:hypothetical protein [Pseudomonadota bacterium]
AHVSIGLSPNLAYLGKTGLGCGDSRAGQDAYGTNESVAHEYLENVRQERSLRSATCSKSDHVLQQKTAFGERHRGQRILSAPYTLAENRMAKLPDALIK